MTYNQLNTELTSLLQSHAMIKTVKNLPISDWYQKQSEPIYPVCVFNILNMTLGKGREQTYIVQFFFLDKSGADRQFEDQVISDQFQIASDITQLMRAPKRDYYIDDTVNVTTIADSKEEFLAGVEMTINMTTQSAWDGCNAPIF